jgi:hypothetical protein
MTGKRKRIIRTPKNKTGKRIKRGCYPRLENTLIAQSEAAKIRHSRDKAVFGYNAQGKYILMRWDKIENNEPII